MAAPFPETRKDVQDQLTSIRHPEAHEQAPEVSAHGRHGHFQLLGDLFVGPAAQKPLDNLGLSARQAQVALQLGPLRL
jgi:hypothetical protein